LANVTGSNPPYTYTWDSSTTDLSGYGASDVLYQIPPGREAVTSETLRVSVRNKNGVIVYAARTVDVNVPAALGTMGPLDTAGRDFGTERGVCGTLGKDNQQGFEYRMKLDGVKQLFSWSCCLAWERDFKDPACRPAGLDPTYVDNVDMTFYIGHGWPGGFTFEPSPPCVPPFHADHQLTCADAARCGCAATQCPLTACNGGWGNKDIEWLALLSCNVLYKNAWEWYPQRWAPAFNGLHQMLGFHTVAWDAPTFGWMFADGMLGQWCGWKKPLPVREAWFRAKQLTQPGGTVAAVMGPYCIIQVGNQLVLISNFNDYFWGKGPVGPDIRPPFITGYWYVQQ
jgi:hypothetical protein